MICPALCCSRAQQLTNLDSPTHQNPNIILQPTSSPSSRWSPPGLSLRQKDHFKPCCRKSLARMCLSMLAWVAVLAVVRGDYLIADTGNHRVQLCPATFPGFPCQTVAGMLEPGSDANQLNTPRDDAVTAEGDHVIVDQEYHNFRIQLCPAASPGEDCETVVSGFVHGQDMCAGGVAIDAEGNCIITDRYRVLRCHASEWRHRGWWCLRLRRHAALYSCGCLDRCSWRLRDCGQEQSPHPALFRFITRFALRHGGRDRHCWKRRHRAQRPLRHRV